VLGSPDNQRLPDEAAAYEGLTEPVEPLAIGGLPERRESLVICELSIEHFALADHGAHLLSLAGKWFGCTARRSDGPIWIVDAVEYLRGGMSGSPIVADDGKAVGVFVASSGSGSAALLHDEYREGGPNPYLLNALPGWLRAKSMALRRISHDSRPDQRVRTVYGRDRVVNPNSNSDGH
jgi:hypothetical protein